MHESKAHRISKAGKTCKWWVEVCKASKDKSCHESKAVQKSDAGDKQGDSINNVVGVGQKRKGGNGKVGLCKVKQGTRKEAEVWPGKAR